jgi:hypothetical protein
VLILVTYHDRTPTFEWYVIRCGSKNTQQKDLCVKGVGLHVQNMMIVGGSIVNIIGGGTDMINWESLL